MKNTNAMLQKTRWAFAKEESEKTWEQKVKLSEMILRLKNSRKKRFGLFIVFGWKNDWNREHADISDSSQDIFAKNKIDVFRKTSFKKIVSTINFDGAILIDKNGIIRHSGMIISQISPRALANELSKNSKEDLSTRLGFRKKVHTRHLAAITTSWTLKDTTVFTISEETGDIHIFEKGQIIFSTVPAEIKSK